MTRQSSSFARAFLLTAPVITALVYHERTFTAVAVGTMGLLGHWISTRSGADDESADSSYFFGFLLTLTILAVGLYKLGAVAGGTATPGASLSRDSTTIVLGFLRDLSAGLLLTILGLFLRQLRALATTQVASPDVHAITAERELIRKLDALLEVWRSMPDQEARESLHHTGTVAQVAVATLRKEVIEASKRMTAATRKLDDAVSTATQAMTRAAAGVSESLSLTTQRLQEDTTHHLSTFSEHLGVSIKALGNEVALVLSTMEEQRIRAGEALARAHSETAKIQADAANHQREHLELWRTTLEQSRAALDHLHKSLDEEYRRGMEGYASSGQAFAELTTRTVTHIESLPDPATRLEQLWAGMSGLDSRLTEASKGLIGQITELRSGSDHLAASFTNLGESSHVAAGAITSGSQHYAQELQRELRHMNELVDEYVSMLQATTKALRMTT